MGKFLHSLSIFCHIVSSVNALGMFLAIGIPNLTVKIKNLKLFDWKQWREGLGKTQHCLVWSEKN